MGELRMVQRRLVGLWSQRGVFIGVGRMSPITKVVVQQFTAASSATLYKGHASPAACRMTQAVLYSTTNLPCIDG